MFCVFCGVFGEKYDFAEFSRPFSAVLEISQNWPPELQEVQPLSTVPKAPRGAAEGRPLGVFPQDMRGVCKYVLNCSFHHPTPSAQKSRLLLHSEALCSPA